MNRYKKLKTKDIFTLKIIRTWQKFYENEAQLILAIQLPPFRAQLMKKLPNFDKFSNFSNHINSKYFSNLLLHW
ncbi:DUF4951 domain-containing protein [Acinetobacter terrae]|uniref:DUF4951 domain-containing protein n=1 Tax=Acinetobacter terrae TaxID=2731247 RepID=UPI00396A32DD